ncbi:hypothetical protein [Variovorax saccharolyticus]|uniref:hypothetical protein n=1 Tax=Variovorax saccharolyticus TaxID=3053516 RepID=UPI002577350D|nr:hypothetical protein [Variovorax sp. J31P216]MDM0030085.1 hypothetical protein [Variovorax sp. J31P216]
MTPKKELLYKLSGLGTLGFLGFFFENSWIRNSLFCAGGLLLVIGWALGMELQGERTIKEKEERDKAKK